jgi:hypothetical protein
MVPHADLGVKPHRPRAEFYTPDDAARSHDRPPRRFAMIPEWLRRRSDVGPRARDLFAALWTDGDWADDRRTAAIEISRPAIARLLGVKSKRTVDAAIECLVRAGALTKHPQWVDRDGKRCRDRSRYELHQDQRPPWARRALHPNDPEAPRPPAQQRAAADAAGFTRRRRQPPEPATFAQTCVLAKHVRQQLPPDASHGELAEAMKDERHERGFVYDHAQDEKAIDATEHVRTHGPRAPASYQPKFWLHDVAAGAPPRRSTSRRPAVTSPAAPALPLTDDREAQRSARRAEEERARDEWMAREERNRAAAGAAVAAVSADVAAALEEQAIAARRDLEPYRVRQHQGEWERTKRCALVDRIVKRTAHDAEHVPRHAPLSIAAALAELITELPRRCDMALSRPTLSNAPGTPTRC